MRRLDPGMSAAAPRLLDHPVAAAAMTRLRARDTPPDHFRALVHRIGLLLGAQALAELRTEQVEVETPLAVTRGERLAEETALVPVLRAGLGLVDPLLTLLPEATVRHLGFYRDEQSLAPVAYYNKLPKGGAPPFALLLDPMLATGGTACAAAAALRDWGVARIHFLGLVGAPEGVARLAAEHPEVVVHLAALDEGLNEQGYILPGLGDAGDRVFATP